MVKFQGEAVCKVDDKGRIVLPAAFRDAFARAGETDMTMIVKRSVQTPRSGASTTQASITSPPTEN